MLILWVTIEDGASKKSDIDKRSFYEYNNYSLFNIILKYNNLYIHSLRNKRRKKKCNKYGQKKEFIFSESGQFFNNRNFAYNKIIAVLINNVELLIKLIELNFSKKLDYLKFHKIILFYLI